jgi:hypothetical protein
MLTATPLFSEALRYSHRALTRVTLMLPGETSGFVDGPVLSVSSGSLRIDGTRNVWRSGNMTLVPIGSVDRDDLVAIDSTSRLRIERGIRYPNGRDEWVTIALVQVTEASLSLKEAAISVAFSDLGSLVEDFKLTTPYVPQDMDGNWMTTVDAIKDLVKLAVVWDVVPDWVIDPSIDQVVKPITTTVFTGSRWEAIKTLSDSLGAVTYFRPDGHWAIRSAEANLANPVMHFSIGRDGVVVDYERTISRTDQYNAIPLRWESPNIGGLVFIVDADPTSPTFWNGPFGRHPKDEENNDTIVTEGQAISAARALLDQYRGRAASINFSSVHNPLLEPLDVITLEAGSQSETHIVDSIDYPLAGGTMRVKTRLVRQVVNT